MEYPRPYLETWMLMCKYFIIMIVAVTGIATLPPAYAWQSTNIPSGDEDTSATTQRTGYPGNKALFAQTAVSPSHNYYAEAGGYFAGYNSSIHFLVGVRILNCIYAEAGIDHTGSQKIPYTGTLKAELADNGTLAFAANFFLYRLPGGAGHGGVDHVPNPEGVYRAGSLLITWYGTTAWITAGLGTGAGAGIEQSPVVILNSGLNLSERVSLIVDFNLLGVSEYLPSHLLMGWRFAFEHVIIKFGGGGTVRAGANSVLFTGVVIRF